MDEILNYINTLLSIVITKNIDKYLSLDTTTTFALATALCGLIVMAIKYLKVYMYNPFQTYSYIIDMNTSHFSHVSKLIESKYKMNILQYRILNKSGKKVISDIQPINITHDDVVIQIATNKSCFRLSSRGNITPFIDNIVKINYIDRIIVNTYTNAIKYSTASDSVDGAWRTNSERANKTLDNTFYSQKILDTFIQYIDEFIHNENKYISLGDNYTTGYILYGPPGTGKTSLVKIIAKMYDMPIFIIDLNIIRSDTIFTALCTSLRDAVINLSHYIVLFEDFDRTKIMNRYGSISVGVLLNFLDGVQSSHGRIVIITCNDLSKIKQIPAIIRPGRIDSIIHINVCDEMQIHKTLEFRYDVSVSPNINLSNIIITPSCLIQLIKCVTYDEILEIFEQYTKFDDIDFIIRDYNNTENIDVIEIVELVDTFDNFIKQEMDDLKIEPADIVAHNNNNILMELTRTKADIEKKIKHQKLLNKIQEYIFSHPGDASAVEYLTKLVNN